MKKYLLLIIFLIGCVEHIPSTDVYRWETNEIDIILDSSLEEIAAPEIIYPMAEESLMLWIDEIDKDITINFIYGECDYIKSCVTMMDYDPNRLAIAQTTHAEGVISRSIIYISRDTEWSFNTDFGYNLEHTFIHEFGHLMGLHHSNDSNSIMYPIITTKNDIPKLSDIDKNNIQNLYN